MRFLKAVGAMVLLLAVLESAGRCARAQGLDGWDKVQQDASQLRADGKLSDAIAVLESFLAQHPKVGDAHWLLGMVYRDLADTVDEPGPGLSPARRHPLERAAAHFEHSLQLTTDPRRRFVTMTLLVQLQRADGLNQLGDAEALARRMVEEHPTRFLAPVLLAHVLRERDRLDAAAAVLRNARKTVRDLPAIHVLELDAARVQALQAEADRLRDLAAALRARRP